MKMVYILIMWSMTKHQILEVFAENKSSKIKPDNIDFDEKEFAKAKKIKRETIKS